MSHKPLTLLIAAHNIWDRQVVTYVVLFNLEAEIMIYNADVTFNTQLLKSFNL